MAVHGAIDPAGQPAVVKAGVFRRFGRAMVLAAAAIGSVASLSQAAFAANRTWTPVGTGTTAAKWGTAAVYAPNWSGGVTNPTAADSAIFNAGGTRTVTPIAGNSLPIGDINVTGAGNFIFANALNSNIVISGTGASPSVGINVTGAGNATFNGKVLVNSATMTFQATGAGQLIFGGGGLDLQGNYLKVAGNANQGSLRSSVSGATYEVVSGTQTLAFDSALGGNISTLVISGGRVSGDYVSTISLQMNGGTYDLGGGKSWATLSGSSGAIITTTVSEGATLTTSSAVNSTFAGLIENGSGTVSLVKEGSGTLTLSGANTYSGGTTVSAGSLVGTTTSLQGAITNNAAVTFDQSTAGTYAGVMSGNGSLTKLGGGAVTLTGANTYSGGTTVSAGTLLVNGSLANSAVTVGNGGTLGGSGSLGALLTVQSGGTLSPGNSPGVLAAAALDLEAGSTTFMEVIGNGANAGVAGTGYDQIQITTSGGLTYGGGLNLNFGNSSQFLNGTVFDLFAFSGTPIGHFSAVTSTGTGLYAGFNFSGSGGIWTSTIGDQLLTLSELTGRLTFSSSGGSVPEIDSATGSSALSLVAGVLAMLEQRRRRRRRRGSAPTLAA